MKNKIGLLTFLISFLLTLSVNCQVIDTMFNYSILRHKRIIELENKSVNKSKKIKERTFIGIKSKDRDRIIFGRLELILDSAILITTIKEEYDTLIILNPHFPDDIDSIISKSVDYDTSYFISINEIETIYRSVQNQLIKVEIALLLLATGIGLLLIPPVVALLVNGTLKGFISTGMIYVSASGTFLALWGKMKYNRIKTFRSYDLDYWDLKFIKKDF